MNDLTDAQMDELTDLIEATHGDSNDDEILAWRELAEYACGLLGVEL